MQINCFISKSIDNFIDISEMILSDKGLSIDSKVGKEEYYPFSTYKDYLEEDLIQAYRMAKVQASIEAKFLENQIVGTRVFSPSDGFFWEIYRDIRKINPGTILKDIFDGVEERIKSEKLSVSDQDRITTIRPKTIQGYYTYFYPALWIGDKPEFNFKARINGIWGYPWKTYGFKYKGTSIFFNKKGLFFVGSNDDSICLRYMNEIIGTAILNGYNFEVISERDIAEMTKTEQNGMSMSYSHPLSLNRLLQAQSELTPIKKEVLDTYQQITYEDLKSILQTAELYSNETNISDYVVFFAQSTQYVRDEKYGESFLFDWSIIERFLVNKLLNYLDEKEISEKRKETMEKWNISHVIEVLSIDRIINEQMYKDVNSLRKVRNNFFHKGIKPIRENAEKCHSVSEKILRNLIDNK